jgi:hypothetical protein
MVYMDLIRKLEKRLGTPDSLFNWAIGPSINPMLDCIKFP